MMELKALEEAADEGISPGVFSMSYSWRRRFMHRHKLSIRARTRQGQTTPEDATSSKAKLRGDVRRAIVENDVCTVFDTDQTGMHPPKTKMIVPAALL